MSELLRRKELLKKIQSQKNGFIKPSFLKENNIYRGAQGIYIDQTLTKNIVFIYQIVLFLHMLQLLHLVLL